MATGIMTTMAISAATNVAVGVAGNVFSGQPVSMGSVAGDALNGAASGGASAVTGGGGAGGGGGDFTASDAFGMMSSFGKSVLGNSKALGEAQYNSQMAELRNYRTMQQGIYGHNVSRKEAEIVKKQADIRLAALRREMYRRNHSVGGYRGVRLDSGSAVAAEEDLIRQAEYDMELVKYQADIDAGRHEDQGRMSLWNAQSSTTLNQNEIDKRESDARSSIGQSMKDTGINMAESLLSAG